MGVLRNFTNFTKKHLCWSLFLIKLQEFMKVNYSVQNIFRYSRNSSWLMSLEEKQPFKDVLQNNCCWKFRKFYLLWSEMWFCEISKNTFFTEHLRTTAPFLQKISDQEHLEKLSISCCNEIISFSVKAGFFRICKSLQKASASSF